ncbi:protocadherin gamma-A3-like [Triplophysa dalaica]|uniref:protocadherin gamma-A3-like n=1 Tax=Triplophysa dalaica TaxID=1582913 RepID=UPI0024DF5759|nr:protocadherin gamma-A3-like [Triplophysa dalaica]
MERPTHRIKMKCFVFMAVLSFHLCLGDLRYSISEERRRGSTVGKIAQDLGMDTKTLSSRKPRVDFEGSKRYCDINPQSGEIVVNERIDREALCGQKQSCAIHFDFFLENPLELHRVTLEIQDINDNAPKFRNEAVELEIQESAIKGAHFSLDEAYDPDFGTNSVQSYTLSNNEHFILSPQRVAGRGRLPEIVLENELDREKQDRLFWF